MLAQQQSFKLGEWAPEAGKYVCAACDRRTVETVVDLDKAQVFPFCPKCKELGKDEPDQLWLRLGDREAWRRAHATRWREVLK
mgnify:CR=1 FL=1